MNNENILKPFAKSYAYFPFLCAAFIFGLMLLFYKELDCTIRTILVPAFAVYIMGTSIIGYVYFEMDRINCVMAAKRGESPLPQPRRAVWTIRGIHIIWLLTLIYYLFYRSVL